VVSVVNGDISGCEWDLDRVETEDDWLLSILESNELEEQPFIKKIGNCGTLIVWRELDRLFEETVVETRAKIVHAKMAIVERHLALVFHRFLSGEVKGRQKLSIRINGHRIAAFDPFCRKNEATQSLREEKVWVGDVPVVMQPYILPHHSRLSASDYDYYQDRSDFISNQGAYIYRNGRLMAWGDWFRLVTKGEATKLARVQIDFPNTLDEAWTIDIKKSRARPPHAVRERLGQIVNQIIARSVTVHRGRGQKLFQESQAPLWDRYSDQGGIRYAVNIQHPLIQSLADKLSSTEANKLNLVIESIAASIPFEMIYSDYSTSPRQVAVQGGVDKTESLERLKNLRLALFGDDPGNEALFLQIVKSTHLFEGQADLVEDYTREVFK
jgi:hypothetical protein